MDSKFSDDINMEILSRASLKTFDAMRCISKEFEKLSYDSNLLKLYQRRNNIISGFIGLKHRKFIEYTHDFAPAPDSPESNSLDLSFLPRNSTIVASSEQGIIVLESPEHPNRRGNRLVCWYVCKPATKQILALPKPQTKYFTEKVAMVVMGSNPLHYKIVILSPPTPNIGYREHTSCRCEIFDSRAWKWRLHDLLILPCPVVLINGPLITASGSIYKLLPNNEVLKFDAYSEKWTTFSSPIQTLNYDQTLNNDPSKVPRKLVRYKGKLGFACMTPSLSSWEIWGLTVDQSWEKLHIIDINNVRNYCMVDRILVTIYGSETGVMWDTGTLVFYRFRGGDHASDHIISRVPMIKDGYFPLLIFPFRSDFEPVDLSTKVVDKC